MAGWPAGYPTRGAWRFRNVRREFQFWPKLESIEVTQDYPDMVATFSCEVVDQDEGYEFVVEDEVRVFFEKAGEDEVRIFAGHIKVVTLDREDEHGPRMWRLEAQDYTAKAGDAIIRQREHRKKESAIRRIRWIVSYLDNAWHVDDKDYDVPDEDVEREDMYGMTVAEALDSVCNEIGGRWWIDVDNTLHVHKTKTIAAPFDLDNDSPDYSSSFPFREFSWRRDSTDIANAVLVEPEERRDSRWAVAPANIAQYEWGDSTGRQERFISAEEIRTARAAERKADVQLQRLKTFDSEGTLVCWEPGLYAGMHVGLVESLWEIDNTVRIIRVVITAEDPHDENGTALLRSELTVTNKPHRRSPRMGRPETGDGRTVNQRRQTVDDFSRVVSKPAVIDGDNLAGSWTFYRVEWGIAEFLHTGQFGGDPRTYVGEGPPFGPTFSGPYSLAPRSAAVAGSSNTTWPFTPLAGIGFGGWSGLLMRESWGKFTITEHPADMAGLKVAISVNPYVSPGVDQATYPPNLYGAQVRVSSTQPSAGNQGVLVGYVPAAGGTVEIPGSLVPAEGGSVWVCVAAGWSADYQGVWDAKPAGQAYALALTTHVAPIFSGEFNSGQFRPGFGTVTWRVYDGSAAVDWGTTAASEWQGGNTWQQASTEGSPTDWGMDGEAVFLSAEAPAGLGLYVMGEGEDGDEPVGPWTDADAAVELTFEVDEAGDTGSSGPRHLQLIMVGEGDRAVGWVQLGDSDYAAGIRVAGPVSTDYAAKTISGGTLYKALFDTRAGYVRGKLWPAAEIQPAAWDVECEMDETEDEGDRMEIWLRAGNGEGEEQTLRLHHIAAYPAGAEGDTVDMELLGLASGDENEFRPAHRYAEGTLHFYVNGVADPTTWEDGIAARVDIRPTADSIIHATYIIGDETED